VLSTEGIGLLPLGYGEQALVELHSGGVLREKRELESPSSLRVSPLSSIVDAKGSDPLCICGRCNEKSFVLEKSVRAWKFCLSVGEAGV
jgi:hypothetical protein